MGHIRSISHTADIAYEITAATREELFATAVLAWKQSVVGNSEVAQTAQADVQVEGIDPEELLVNLLGEVNYLFEVRHWVTARADRIHIRHRGDGYFLEGIMYGEPFHPERHQVLAEIKAATFHQINIEKTAGGLRTKIIFDI